MNGEIEVKVNTINRRRLIRKTTKITVLIILFILVLAFIIMNVVYNNGNFTITLDKNLYFQRGIVIYEDPDYKVFRTELYAKAVEYFDNISYRWLPDDIDEGYGSHNGHNYIAYTFYVENTGTDVSDYWSQVIIDDVIKNVDAAIRLRIYMNGEHITYAKKNINGEPEYDTIPFMDDTLITFNHREEFKPGDIDKYTVVLWIEGSDLDCTDNILGGEIKLHMEFNSEFIDVNDDKFETE